MLKPLTEQDNNIGYAIGFVGEWMGPNAPLQVEEHFKLIVQGVKDYRDKYIDEQINFANLQTKYNELTAVSAGYLAEIQRLPLELDEQLVEDQRPFHKTENQNETV